jgi:hypothetical protein
MILYLRRPMADLPIPTDSKTAMYVVCLYLAQSGKPHLELGYDTQSRAIEDIANRFKVAKRSVQNERDSYDHFTDSTRIGWKASSLPPRLQPVFDQYGQADRDILLNLSKAILSAKTTPEPALPLPDLEECQRSSKERAKKIPLDQCYLPEQEVWDLVVDAYLSTGTSDEVVVVGGTTLVLTTAKGNFLTISAQEIPRCWAVRPYVLGILAYERKVDELATKIGVAGRSSSSGKQIFKNLPSADGESNVPSPTVSKIKNAIEHSMGFSEVEKERFLLFLSNSSWSGVAKTLERTDWAISAIQSAGGWLAVASARRGELSIALAESNDFEYLMQTATHSHAALKKPLSQVSVSPITGGENVIFYGAPGTGKSNRINSRIDGAISYRTVFHPDLQNSDFFGCLKPTMDGEKVCYRFAPGPFMEALAAAYISPSTKIYLVIEELNRAAAAAVFGDLFLLLDRDTNGHGEYDVSFPSLESRDWFERQTGAHYTKLRVPSNLFIYATMNSADQGVYPIDTAFRRRWRQEYIPLNYKSGPIGSVAYVDAEDKSRNLSWRNFAEILNNYLTDCENLDVAEDRLLGQWFVKENDLDGKGIPEKVLLYLWDDLLRHEGRNVIFQTNRIKNYGTLVRKISKGKRFLSDDILSLLNPVSNLRKETTLDANNGST